METKSTSVEMNQGPMINDIRLSRLSHPRATLVAMILLAAVFLLFGVFADGMQAVAHVPAPNTIEGAAMLLGDWAFSGWTLSG